MYFNNTVSPDIALEKMNTPRTSVISAYIDNR